MSRYDDPKFQLAAKAEVQGGPASKVSKLWPQASSSLRGLVKMVHQELRDGGLRYQSTTKFRGFQRKLIDLLMEMNNIFEEQGLEKQLPLPKIELIYSEEKGLWIINRSKITAPEQYIHIYKRNINDIYEEQMGELLKK